MEFNIIQESQQVMKVETIQTETQIATVETYYDQIYHTDLVYDAATNTVTATVSDYLGDKQTTFADQVPFVYDGQTVTVHAASGSASITFTSTVPGDHVISTQIPNFRNGSVTVHV